jgi:hypothetical protein
MYNTKIILPAFCFIILFIALCMIGCAQAEPPVIEEITEAEVTETDVTVVEETSEEQAAPDVVKMIIVHKDGALMSGPGDNYDVLTILVKGEKLILFKQDNEWFNVLTPDQTEGWVHGDYIKLRHSERADYEDYKLLLSDDVINDLNKYTHLYGVYQIQIIDHSDWAENFVGSLGRDDLKFEKISRPALAGSDIHTMDQSQYLWVKDNHHSEFVSYDVAYDIVSFKFQDGIDIPGVTINPNNPASILRGLRSLSKQFFSEDFNFRVDNIVKNDAHYVIYYSRLLDGVAVKSVSEPSLTVTPEGKLVEGSFLLAEFKEHSKTKVPTIDYIIQNLENLSTNKVIISFSLPYDTYESDYEITRKETVRANLEQADLVYQYGSKFNILIAPSLIFKGKGVVETELDTFETQFEVYFHLLSREEINRLKKNLE